MPKKYRVTAIITSIAILTTFWYLRVSCGFSTPSASNDEGTITVRLGNDGRAQGFNQSRLFVKSDLSQAFIPLPSIFIAETKGHFTSIIWISSTDVEIHGEGLEKNLLHGDKQIEAWKYGVVRIHFINDAK